MLVPHVTGRLYKVSVCLFLAQQPPVVHDLLIHEISRSHTTTHTVGRTPLDE